MTNSKFCCAAIVLSVALSVGGSHASASSALIRTSPHHGQSWSAQTYAGTAEVSVSAMKPSSSITVLVLADTLGTTEREQARSDLLDFYSTLRGRAVQIGFLTKDGAFTLPVVVASRARLKQLLEKNVSGEGIQTIPSAVALDDLIAAIPKLGPKQSSVLVVGEFPKLDPASTAFASALLVRAFLAQQLRASLFSPIPADEWSSAFRSLAGESVTALNDLPAAPVGKGEAIMQLDWTPATPPAGFVIAHSAVTDEAGRSVCNVPDIAQAEAVILPSVQQYADAQKKIAEAEQLLKEDLSEARADRIREDIAAALQLNSRDQGALVIATGLYEKAQDFPNAVKMASYLVEISPRDGSAYARFGHELRLNAELDRADLTLKKASELGVTTLPLNEDFARLQLSRNDDKGALPYLQEVLRQDAKRQDIWFLQAQTAERTENASLAEHSYQQGLALGGVHVAESGSLLRLYIAGRQTDQATQLAKAQLASLPPSGDDRIQFAAILDELHQSDFALQGWRSVLAIQPASERAHTRVARLLFEGGNAAGAEEEAVSGLAAAPNSAPLHLLKADAEEHLGRIYDARRTLQDGAATISDVALAAQLATLEERFFGGAPAAYARLAELSNPSSPDQLRALERGFDMSMRDGDLQQAAKFASSLESSGQRGYRALLGEEKTASSRVMVPGSLNALAFTAHASKEEISPERFFLEYCRTLINGGVDAGKNEYIEGIRDYFERLADLRALGTNKAGETSITLSLADKNARRQTEKALNFLGIRVKSSKGEVELAQGEKKSQAIKQETAAALALDEVAIQEALQSGKPYRLEIHDEPASIYPSERIWRDALGLKSSEAGGFAEELLRVPHMARTYVSLNSMDRAAADELLKAFPLRELCDHESDLLLSFAPALALEGNHAAVPGGVKAEPLWASLVGVSPAIPGPFFRALIKHDDGKLLAYFSVLAQLNRPHQAFFTANERRVTQFYDLLTSTRQMKVRPYGEFQDSGFQRMLRSVPLDEDGHVEFPGSAEVWTVAKGTSSSEQHTAHLMKKVRKAATPDVEDAVLARLTETQYKEKNAHLTELDNFLAVSSVDLHRKEPMDEESALLLAQKYADYAATYPYLTDLRTLTVEDYRQFFSAFERISTHSTLDANLQLGQLHSLTEWICLLVQRHALKDEDATDLIRRLTSSFASAEDAASYTVASLEATKAILRAGKAAATLPPDEAVRACMLGHHAAANDERLKHYLRVLDAQHVPSLTTVLQVYEASVNLASAKPSFNSVDLIQKGLGGLPTVEIPKEAKVKSDERSAILRYDPASARKVAVQLKEKTTKKKVNPKDLQKLVRDLQGELQGQVTAALAGPIYAYFLRSSDAIVMNDPLLLRKHRYFDFDVPSEHQRILESDFSATSDAAGSYFVGGFAQFAYSAGLAATHSKNLGSTSESMAAQLATIRSADWDRIDESCQRLAALRVIVAREWIYESSRKPEAFRALSDETMGLLSLSRRAQLLNGIASREWRRVWDSITLPELFALGGRYAKQFPTDPWPSQATVALRASEKAHTDGQLNVLGAIPGHIFGCNHPHLLSDAPYEEYERHLPSQMGERSAEFKLFLAFQSDRLGLRPDMLDNVDESLAVKAFRKAQMTDYRDWRSLFSAFASINPSDLERAIRND